ncbi:MAG: restriction endonuclease subunit S [Planctomycetia bacterium]|nr:restriction endonuclease subunit S [Planctomycetia bacterium]
MAKLSEASLDDVCLLVTDGTHDTPKRVKDGFPLIKAKEIGGEKIDFETCDQISGEEHLRVIARSKPEYGDTLFAHIGASLGEAAFVKTHRPFSIKNIALFKPNLKIIDERYLYYLVISPAFQGLAKQIKTGSAQPFLSLGHLRSHRITYHEALNEQRKIAAILSAYDDLIENNLRRIKILEEMAQNLYREWFVKFRFPGHQQARFTNSPLGLIPEGWEVSVLGEHLIALESGKRPKGGAKDLAFGIPSVGAENIFGIGRHKYQSEKYVSREFFKGMRQGVVKDGDVALYKDGAYIGRSAYFRDSFPHAQFCVNEHVFLLRTTGKRLTQNILYLWLQETDTVSGIRATNANAAQPGINQKGVNGVSLIVPPLDIAGRFDQLAEPSLALIVSLAKRNEALRRTRDLLLPRLISGEVDVSELDIAVPEEVL